MPAAPKLRTTPSTHRQRNRDLLASMLLVQAVLAAVVAIRWFDPPVTSFPSSVIFPLAIVVALAAAAASMFEWTHQPAGEAIAVVACLTGMALAAMAIISGWYVIGPSLVTATVVVIIALVDRFAVRDSGMARSRGSA